MRVGQLQLLKREQFLLFPQRLMPSSWSKRHRNLVLVAFGFHFIYIFILFTFVLDLLAVNLRWILFLGFLCFIYPSFCINGNIIWFGVLPNDFFQILRLRLLVEWKFESLSGRSTIAPSSRLERFLSFLSKSCFIMWFL